MATKNLDSGIYGADDTNLAESVSSGALNTSGTGMGSRDLSDYWGDTRDNDAMGKGNTPEYEDYQVKIVRELEAAGGDVDPKDTDYPQNSRMPRHVPGPKKSTPQGAEVGSPPPSRQTSKSVGKYPNYKG